MARSDHQGHPVLVVAGSRPDHGRMRERRGLDRPLDRPRADLGPPRAAALELDRVAGEMRSRQAAPDEEGGECGECEGDNRRDDPVTAGYVCGGQLGEVVEGGP